MKNRTYKILLTKEPEGPDREMAKELTKKHKVASIPVSVFYQDKTDNKLLRFCFAKKNDTLDQAIEILRKF